MKTARKSASEILSSIGKELRKELVDDAVSAPSASRCVELVQSLEEETQKQTMTVTLLKNSQIGLTLGKAVKSIRRVKRTDETNRNQWNELMNKCQAMIKEWKSAVANESKHGKTNEGDDDGADQDSSLPSSISTYRSRLTRQSKEMYKDPPVLPPAAVGIEESKCPLPKRDKTTGALTFQAGKDVELKSMLKDFHPNRIPEEVLRAGSFGGTYFRPIVSAVTNQRYKSSEVIADTLPPESIEGLDRKLLLTSSTYRPQVNKFGVKCGGSLGMWESSGWIADSDPYGWFQWYCRFYQGRRCSDDARQISRWLKCAGPKGRFRSQLCNKILRASAEPGDTSISPVIRQTLLHWGLEITAEVLEKHKKRVG